MKYILRKIASLVITLMIISFVTFFAFSVIPGDAAVSKLGADATDEQIEALREKMGLNDPFFTRYGKWLGGTITGNPGNSLQYDRPVKELIGTRLQATFGLAIMSLIFILIISMPLGVVSALKPEGAVDNFITIISQMGMAIPQFFLGIILTLIFGIVLHIFQVGGYVGPTENFFGFLGFIILPALAVAIPKSAMMTKFLRDCIVAEKEKDYVRTAKAKGNNDLTILYRHVLKNAVISTITFFAMIIADVLAGSIVVEQVFSIPGLGRLLITSISNRDFPVVSVIVVYSAALVVIFNTLADISYRLVDPRVGQQDE